MNDLGMNYMENSNSSAVYMVDKRGIAALACHAETSEKSIERYLVAECHKRQWLCLKYSNMSEAGYPDRLIVMHDGLSAWCELKSAGRHTTPLQQRRMYELTARGHAVRVCDSREAVDEYIRDLEDYAGGC